MCPSPLTAQLFTHMSRVTHSLGAAPLSTGTEEAAPEQEVWTGGAPGGRAFPQERLPRPQNRGHTKGLRRGPLGQASPPTARHSVPLREGAWRFSNHLNPAHWIVHTFTVKPPNQPFRNKT